ncbi:hypothetical protein CIL03_01690 [Virgibacillus indicus]|uniref:AAA domain-containing protein n=1 Tax=Virgibacillus indicus TaxID=2024554 RepID=A0A265NCX4_9BACI|nr:AAA family ATPase [Virgibacillus indicus]OZU89878.1 hypothetical protein CIL03_01690 [Virgibacillus indicus]
MKKIRIVIADNNLSYLESLSSYMRSSNETSRFIVTYFSDKEKLKSYMSEEANIDILLINPQMYSDDLILKPQITVILLEDDLFAAGNKSYEAVYRYQRLNQLVSSVLSIYYERNETAGKLLARSKQTKVLSVYSPVGGSGKTTVAVNLSKQLALNNSKVFYLNLEVFNSTKLYFTSPEDDPSLQIFYYVKAESKQLLSKIEGLKKYDPYSMVDYFDLEISGDEMLEMNEQNVKTLIDGIVGTGVYDYVIVDLDSSLAERNIAVLKDCDQVIWNISNDVQSLLKTKAFFEEEEKLVGKENIVKDKLIVIINKYAGTMTGHMEEFGITVDGYLPFIPNWSSVQSSTEILGNEIFNQEIQAIIHEKIKNEMEGAATVGE